MMSGNKLIIFIGSLFYPIYFLPLAFQYVIKNEKFGYFMISLFMGMLAYTMIPYDTMDIVRHYEKFELFSSISFDELFLEGRLVDYIFNVYAWAIINIGLSKEFVPLSVTFISYYFYLITFKIIIDREFASSQSLYVSYKYIVLLGFFLIINEIRFMDASSGLRNIFSFSIFSYALISYIYTKKYFSLILLSLLAIGIHFSAFIALLIFLVSNFIRLSTFSKGIYVVCYFLFVLGATDVIFYFAINKLEPYLREYGLYFPSYFDEDGVWGAGYYLTQNIKSLIFEKYIKTFPLYVAGLYFILFRNFKNEILSRYLFVLFIFITTISVSRTLLDRFNWFFVILFIYFLLIELINGKISNLKRVFIFVFSFSLITMDLGSIYKYRDIFGRSWGDLLYTPFIFKYDNHIEPYQYIIRNSGEQ